MNIILSLIEEPDYCSVLILIGLLWFIGRRLVDAGTRVHRVSMGLAFTALLAYFAYAVVQYQPSNASELSFHIVRGFIASGLIFGPSLIVITVGLFVYHHTLGAAVSRLSSSIRMAKLNAKSKQEEHQRQIRERRQRQESEEARRRAAEEERVRMEAQRAADTAAFQRRETEATRAREEVEDFYKEHKQLLAPVYPPALIKSELKVKIPWGATADEAWQAARDLIDNLRPLIAKRRRQEDALAESKVVVPQLALSDLVAWYQLEKTKIQAVMPDGYEGEIALIELGKRYDALMKEALRSIHP